MWATIEARDGNVHVAPCDEDGDVAAGHLLTTYCPCAPKIERHVGWARDVVIHDEPDADETQAQPLLN